MKKIVSILLFSISFSLSAQFTADSVTVYHNNFILDSVNLKGTSKIPKIDTIIYSNTALDMCGTTPILIVFTGCTAATYFSYDTTYKFPPNRVYSKKIHVYTGWDTSALCVTPSQLTITDTLNWIPCFTTDIEEFTKLESTISLFPNPAHNKLLIETDIEYVTALIFNTNGKLVKSVKANSNEINLQELPSGLYFITIKLSNGKVVTKKLVIQHE